MTFKVTTEYSFTTPSGKTVWKNVSEADGLNEAVPIIPDASADFLVSFTAKLTALLAIWFYSDQDITVYTNDLAGGAPADTIVLTAGIGRMWDLASPCPNFITADITMLYVTNASGSDANCKFGVLKDISDPA